MVKFSRRGGRSRDNILIKDDTTEDLGDSEDVAESFRSGTSASIVAPTPLKLSLVPPSPLTSMDSRQTVTALSAYCERSGSD
jgi:hypothetical protein